MLLIGTGSEVQHAVAAREILASRASRRASSRCRPSSASSARTTSTASRCSPRAVKARVSVEAGSTLGWREIVGDAGRIVSIDHFGESADGALLMKKFGFTAENVAAKAIESVEAAK